MLAERCSRSRAKLHACTQNSWVRFKKKRKKNHLWVFNFSLPHKRKQLVVLPSSEFFSRRPFSTPQLPHLTLMAPSADSTPNNAATLVTVRGLNPECFSAGSWGTCADIPGILRWIGPFPGSSVCGGPEEPGPTHTLVKIGAEPSQTDVCFHDLD